MCKQCGNNRRRGKKVETVDKLIFSQTPIHFVLFQNSHSYYLIMAAYSEAMSQHDIIDLFMNVLFMPSTSDELDTSKAQALHDAIQALNDCGIWSNPGKQFGRIFNKFLGLDQSYLIGDKTMLEIPFDWLDYVKEQKFVKYVSKLHDNDMMTVLETESQLPIIQIRALDKYCKSTNNTDFTTTDYGRTKMMYANVCDQVAMLIYDNGRMTNSGILGEAQTIDRSRKELYESRFVVVLPTFSRKVALETLENNHSYRYGGRIYTYKTKKVVPKKTPNSTRAKKIQRKKMRTDSAQIYRIRHYKEKLDNMINHARRNGIKISVVSEDY